MFILKVRYAIQVAITYLRFKNKQDIPTESGVTNNNKGIYYEM